jgi:hypothetical protein
LAIPLASQPKVTEAPYAGNTARKKAMKEIRKEIFRGDESLKGFSTS